MAIVLDEEVISAPQVRDPNLADDDFVISGGGEGGFAESEAKDLALKLRYGALPVEFTRSAERQVSPTLGEDSLRAGLLAGLIGIAAVVGMVFMLKKSRADQKVLHWALAFVAGGAVGNLIDRIYYSVVTDFVLWKYKTHQWPVFNIADVVLVVGVGLMFIDIHHENKREKALRVERKKKAREQGLVKDLRAD